MTERAECGEACRSFLTAKYAELGVDAHVTAVPPIVATAYEPVVFRCPHGRRWFAEPTSDQQAEWARTRTP